LLQLQMETGANTVYTDRPHPKVQLVMSQIPRGSS
jgi:hypothetical protein